MQKFNNDERKRFQLVIPTKLHEDTKRYSNFTDFVLESCVIGIELQKYSKERPYGITTYPFSIGNKDFLAI